jgi:general stress protein 26
MSLETAESVDLYGEDAIAKVRSVLDGRHLCMFLTHRTSEASNCYPLQIRDLDASGQLWFLSSSRSERNRSIEKDNRVIVTVQNDLRGRYLLLSGRARVHTDSCTIEEYWTPFDSVWFRGRADPSISVIGVVPASGHYWETVNGRIVTLFTLSFS